MSCARLLWLCLAPVVTAPLLVAFVQTPLQISDVLTGPATYYSPKGDFTSFGEIVPNYVHALFRATYLFRPSQVLFNNVQYAIFGPEPGAMYAVKWGLKFASVLLVLAILKRLGVDHLTRYATATLVLYHPSCLDPLLWSADGQATFLMLVAIAAAIEFAQDDKFLQIELLSRWQYVGLFIVWFFLLGVKEICFVICGCLVLFWQARSLRSVWSWVRLTPFYLVLAFWTYRLAEARPASHYALVPSDVLMRLSSNLRFLCPPSPYEVVGWSCLLAIGLAAISAWRPRDALLRWWVLFLATASICGFLFISIPAVNPTARYNITLIHLAALIVGIGLAQMPRVTFPVRALSIVLLPAWMAGDLYTQTLAFVQDTYEFSEALGYLESGACQGYGIACTGESFESEGLFGREGQETVKYYFEKYGPEFFGLPTSRRVYFLTDGEPPHTTYRLLTTHSPAALQKGVIPELGMNQVTEAAEFVRAHQGLLARMQRSYVRLARYLGNEHWPFYDCGTYTLSEKSRYYVYTVDSAKQAMDRTLTVERIQPAFRPGAFVR